MANPQKGVSLKNKLRQVDYLGFVLNTGLLVSLCMATDLGGVLWSWTSGKEIALWVVFGVLLICFSVQQWKSFLTTPDHRIFPADFLKKPIMCILFATMACASTAVFVSLTFFLIYLDEQN